MFSFPLVSRIAVRRRKRLATLDLRALSDRQLDELGLSRIEIQEAAATFKRSPAGLV